MSGIGSMMMNNQTAQMYAQIMANLTEMSRQNAEAMKKIAQSQQEARIAQYQQQLQALEQQEAAEKEEFVKQATQTQTVPVTEDGKDDGKISFWSKLKNIGKGALKAVTGLFCDENGLSLKRTLATVGMIVGGGIIIALTGPVGAAVLTGIGATLGAGTIINGAVKASGAKTDAEAAAAWQEIGGGALEVGLSAAGARVASGKTFTGNKLVQSLKATWDCVKTTGKLAWKAIRHPKRSYADVKNFMQNEGKANWEAMFKSNKAQENKIAQIDKKYAQEIKKYEQERQNLLDELTELKKDPAKNAKQIAKKEAEYNRLGEKIQVKEMAQDFNKADYAESVESYKDVNNQMYRNLMDEYADLSTRGTLSPKEAARLEYVEAAIKQAYQRNNWLEGSNAAAEARNLTIKGIKQINENTKARIKELKAKDKLTDAEKTELKALKEDVKTQEAIIKDMESVRDIEIRTLQAENANARIAKLKAKKEQIADEIKAQKEKIDAETDLDKKIELNKELKELQDKDAKIDELISGNENLIASAKRANHKDNVKSFAKNELKPHAARIANSAAATNSFLFGTNVIPQMQEITVKADNFDEMAQQLEQYQAARRQQLENSYKQQAAFNPMNIFAGLNMGTNSLSYLPPLFPEII